jgi:glycosyltransferase involved in cell wall biosynthesis
MLVAELIRRKSYWLKTAWIACIERRNLEHAAALHATTALEAEQLAPFGFKLRQMTVIPNGVSPLLPDVTELDLPPAVRALPATTPLVLFLGRVHWKKGLDRLIPAMAAVPSACLVVAGNDEENAWPALAALAERVGLTPRLLRLEPQHGRAKQALYQRAQVFALPSYSENFGITVIEALQVGCPVVLTQEVGVAASVLRADCGLVCSGEPLELAAALQRVLTDAALRLELGARGKALIQNEFIWDALARQTLTLYESLRG